MDKVKKCSCGCSEGKDEYGVGKFKPFNLIKRDGSFYEDFFMQIIEVYKGFYLCQEYTRSGSKFNVNPQKYSKKDIDENWELRDK